MLFTRSFYTSLSAIAFTLVACQTLPPKIHQDLLDRIGTITDIDGFEKSPDCEEATLCFSQDPRLSYIANTPSGLEYLPAEFFVMNDHLKSIGLDTFIGNVKRPNVSCMGGCKTFDDEEKIKTYSLGGYFLFADQQRQCEIFAGYTLNVYYTQDVINSKKQARKVAKDHPMIHKIQTMNNNCRPRLTTE